MHDASIEVLTQAVLRYAVTRMQLDPRLGILLDQRANPPRLRPGEELAHDAPGREEEREFVVDVVDRQYICILRLKELLITCS